MHKQHPGDSGYTNQTLSCSLMCVLSLHLTFYSEYFMGSIAKQPTRNNRPRQSKRLWDSRDLFCWPPAAFVFGGFIWWELFHHEAICAHNPPLWWPWISTIHKKGASVCANANVLLLGSPLLPLMINQKLQAWVTELLSLPTANANQLFPITTCSPTLIPSPQLPGQETRYKPISRSFSVYKDGFDNLRCRSGPTINNSIKWHGYYFKQQ